ncbi:hypothetical protein M409DRAFT_59617 [Zasmidium cellare ATCC 36951]|uniref:Uncharacterized protein n=1 Tax=Zasmidium cellare ATCC 36951 TaxID=1080233 RepID=A0A6A6C1A1_ZASCE|nr:uncharacterized protein M409DRAFT_59617 [Zasmidium cellare ATCC 36951]KAF2160824.1 hypothetical protein M409DRAFT_59617 [Zasmidium cellare ATCC 36951]
MFINDTDLQRADGVRMWLEDLRRNIVACHENPHQVIATDSDGNSRSRAIHATPGDEVKVNLSFEEQFNLRGASGVRVTIAIGHTDLDPSDLSNSQSWWIDADNLGRAHAFHFFSTWESENGKAEATRFTFPVPDGEILPFPLHTCLLTRGISQDNPVEGSKNVLWQDVNLANKGCIAVSVVRGDLTDEVQLYPVRCTDPPPTHRWEATDMPKVISWHWFKPMAGEKAPPPVVFELRNTVDSDANIGAAVEAGPSRDGPSIDIANPNEQEALAIAIENSYKNLRTAAQVDSDANDAVSDSDEGTIRGDETPRAIVRLPVQITASGQGRKRTSPPQDTASKPKRSRASDLANLTQVFGEGSTTSNDTQDEEEVKEENPIEQGTFHIKKEAMEVVDLTMDDEDEPAKIKKEMVERRTFGYKKPETREELQLQLQESEEQEKIHQERLKQRLNGHGFFTTLHQPCLQRPRAELTTGRSRLAMPPHHGISVEIIHLDKDEEPADTRDDNNNAEVHDEFTGDILSSSFCVPAGERIALLVGFQFRRGFSPCSASGVSITISIARSTKLETSDHSQTWWVPRKCLGNWNKEKGYDFGEVTRFNRDGSVDEVIPMKAPVPINANLDDQDVTFGREPLEWQLDETPNKGSIIVAIKRGHLVQTSEDDQSSQPRAPTCPPESSRQVRKRHTQLLSDLPELTRSCRNDAKDQIKIIDPAWFKRMRGDNGDPCLWEFRMWRTFSSVAKARRVKAPDLPRHSHKKSAPLHKTADPWRQLQESLKLFPDPPSDREILEERKKRIREEQLALEQHSHDDQETSDDMSTPEYTQTRNETTDPPGSDFEELPSPAVESRQGDDKSARSVLNPAPDPSVASSSSAKSPVGNERSNGSSNHKAAMIRSTRVSQTPAEPPFPNEDILEQCAVNIGIRPTPPASISRSARVSQGHGTLRNTSTAGSPTPLTSIAATRRPQGRNAGEQIKNNHSSQVIDLTEDDDTDIVAVKRESVSDESGPTKRQKTVIDVSEDLEDLEDQLLEVGLRRKIRALKQREGKGVKLEI